MNTTQDLGNRPKVVVLGSGYGGAQCARSLQEKLGSGIELIVIDRRKANVHKIAAARAAVCGDSYSDRVLIPNDSLVAQGMGSMVRGAIKEVSVREVTMEDGVTIPFDFLVCATGAINFSICEPPLRYADRGSMKKFFQKVHKKIRSAERILIVGGGAVGVELAGEIKFEYNSKVVTIVHSGTRLLSRCRPHPGKSFDKKLRQRLEEMGVAVYTGQKILINWQEHGNKPYISSGGIEYVTDKGRKINADLVLLCAGKRVTNHIYPQEWLKEETGQIKVRRSLQLLNMDNIFCVGDLNDIPDNKQAVWAQRQAKVAAENIKRLINGQTKMKKYSPGFGTKRTFIFVGVGRKKGVGHFGYLSVGSTLMRRIKTKDLFTKEKWALYNLKDQVPNEVGGPSQGNKLGTVARPPNLMMTDGMSYNIATRSMEMNRGSIQGQGTDNASRHKSMESVTSLADMYEENKSTKSATKSNLLQANFSEQPKPYGAQAAARVENAGMVSFVGSLVDGDEGANKPKSILKPMNTQEYEQNRTATLERSKKKKHKSNNPTANFDAVPLPNKGNPLGKLNYGQKPPRNEVISFVGAGPVTDTSE